MARGLWDASSGLVYLLLGLVCYSCCSDWRQLPLPPPPHQVPSTVIGLLKQQWTQDLRNVFFENFWFDRHFELTFPSVSVTHPSLGLLGELSPVFQESSCSVTWGIVEVGG